MFRKIVVTLLPDCYQFWMNDNRMIERLIQFKSDIHFTFMKFYVSVITSAITNYYNY